MQSAAPHPAMASVLFITTISQNAFSISVELMNENPHVFFFIPTTSVYL